MVLEFFSFHIMLQCFW